MNALSYKANTPQPLELSCSAEKHASLADIHDTSTLIHSKEKLNTGISNTEDLFSL